MIDKLIQGTVNWLVVWSTDWLMPLTVAVFFAGIFLRGLVYYTIKREQWFFKEFQRRIMKVMDEAKPDEQFSFYPLVKKMLERTFYESFIVRAIMKRRNPDFVMALSDRVFLIQQGSAVLVKDILKQLKYLRRSEQRPKFLDMSKTVFQNNPCFNKLFGIVPMDAVNNMLNILPGLFIVGGIFGTFLGIMEGLPKLSQMDLQDPDGAKLIMDTFLIKISFSMSTSIVGILVSVGMTLANTLMSAEKIFIDIVESCENTLDQIWDRSSDNELPVGLVEFDANKDPLDALASESLQEELKKIAKKVKAEPTRPWNSPSLRDKLKIVKPGEGNSAGEANAPAAANNVEASAPDKAPEPNDQKTDKAA